MKAVRMAIAVPVILGLVAGTLGLAAQSRKPAKPLAGYPVIVVERFAVEQNAATDEFPRGQELGIQQNAVERIEKSRLFTTVVDQMEPASQLAGEQANDGKRLILSGTVVKYDKGSRAARWLVGMGAGATKVKVRFIFRDAETGQELMRTERQGKFYGWVAFVGGSKEQATGEAAGDVVDGLLKEIKKNR